MLCKVLRPFKDKYTGDTYRTGELFECTEERLAEILTVGRLVEIVPGNQSNSCNAEDGDRQRFEGMTVHELREYADKHFKLTFSNKARKVDMIAAILERKRG